MEIFLMQRICLAILRFCLSAWVGIAIFFVMIVLGLRHSDLFIDEVKFNHPKVLFPLYYGFAFVLLGLAFVGALAGLRSAATHILLRLARAAFVGAALGIALLDYQFVYRPLAEMMAAQQVPAARFVLLHEKSRLLNAVVLGFSVLAAIAALWPEGPEKPRLEGESRSGGQAESLT
jgi:hypothetical protein